MLFGWVLGVDAGLKEANRGSALQIPRIFRFIIRYVCPAYLLAILVRVRLPELPAQARAVAERPVAMLTVMFMAVLFAFLWLLVHLAARRWERERRYAPASQRARP